MREYKEEPNKTDIEYKVIRESLSINGKKEAEQE